MSILDRLRQDKLKHDKTEQDNKTKQDSSSWRDFFAELNDRARTYAARHPEEEKAIKSFLKILNLESKYRYPKYRVGEGHPAKDAKVFLHLSEDRMTAYICVFPPLDGGAELTEEKLLADLHLEGIQYGILDKELKRCISEKRYLEIIAIARGTLPRDGEDGELVEYFPHSVNETLEVSPNATIDFSKNNPVQRVKKGDVLCRARFSVPGVEGADVTGEVFPCRQPEKIVIPAGKNTILSPDGTTLCAAIDGILYSSGGDYCVRQQRIFSDSLSSFEGVLRVEGDLYIPGDVSGGVTIEAFGDIIIDGEVRDAHIVSTGGSIRVQKGVHGVEGKTFLSAARQIQALVIESAHVEANDNIIAETVVNSDVYCGGSVSALGGRGIVLGGHIRAAKDILCQQIGNLSENRTRITSGYIAGVSDEYERVEERLKETGATLAKLWENISILRKLGTRISMEQKEVLGWLVEQRKIYEQEERNLKAEKKKLGEKLIACGTGKIVCQQLHPVVEVQVGLRRAEYRNSEVNCRILVREGVISLR